MGLLPHIGQFSVSDARGGRKLSDKFHDLVPGSTRHEAKTP
jgi:hypothetical protein